MADFCRQCSIRIFGSDFGDLKWKPKEGEEDMVSLELCEGCGPIQVKPDGTCVSEDCLEKGHGKREECSGEQHTEVPPAG